MTPLNERQKQLIFDYCIGLTTPEQAAEAETLISFNEEAAQIHSNLKAVFAPLESLGAEACPDELVDSTIHRLNNVARSSQEKLQELLAAEQRRGGEPKYRWWLSLGRRLAAVAVILIIVGVLIPTVRLTTNRARQTSWQQRCQMQLSQMWRGLNSYKADHNGEFPAVARVDGEPWWKVGYQGKQNHSNTRGMYLLVKTGYVNPEHFVCPGRKDCYALKLKPLLVKKYSDFPHRRNITYSFRIWRKKSARQLLGREILISDVNPLFENLPQNYSQGLELQLNKSLASLNSINHNRRGQNILFYDGNVRFVRDRRVGIEQDDIFTLKNIQSYTGSEVPVSQNDAFLAP